MMLQMLLQKMLHYFNDEEGATIIEYSLLAALISVAAVATLVVVGNNVTAVFNYVAGKLVAP